MGAVFLRCFMAFITAAVILQNVYVAIEIITISWCFTAIFCERLI